MEIKFAFLLFATNGKGMILYEVKHFGLKDWVKYFVIDIKFVEKDLNIF